MNLTKKYNVNNKMNNKNKRINSMKKYGNVDCGKEIFTHQSMICSRMAHNDIVNYEQIFVDMNKVSFTNEMW
ncbi:hypothetical protein B6U98_04130 [Thermoplasmatales archaeon ex4572_165]|nr:MAG: hypothetical protein B6U98_04130 [Thermoplasmatales archaeon ex4572_165]